MKNPLSLGTGSAFLINAFVGYLMQSTVFVHSEEGDMSKFLPDSVKNRVFCLRHTSNDISGLMILDVLNDCFEGILSVHNVHDGAVLCRNIEQILDSLRVCRIFIALYV